MGESGDAGRLADGSGASDGTGAGLSRRHFMYGTAATAAGALVFGPGWPSARKPDGVALAGGTGFAWIQSGPKATGTGSVAPTLGTPSTKGNLLVATLLSNDPGTPFTAGSGSGWRLAKAARCAAGRAEIWYYPGTPGNPPHPGNPGNIGSATFTTTGNSGSSCYGAMSEYSLPPGAAITVLDAPGKAAGASGGSFSLTAATGNVAGDLGIAMVADFFGASVTSGTWTAPQGWTQIRQLSTGPGCWAAWYDLSLAAGAQSLTASFSTTGENGWAFAFAAFRAVVFQAIHLDGGEMITMVALDPTGQELVMGGDVEGLWRTADFGDHWQLSQDGLYGQHWRSTACVAWSRLEPGTVYACVGSNAAQANGGFLVSADGGVSWSLRSKDVQFQGNDAGSPVPRPAGEPQDADRSVGDLLVQDPAGGFLYAATYSGGIFRSSVAGNAPNPVGTGWTDIGSSNGQPLLNDGNHYARSLVMNPSSSQELFAGFWDWDPVNNPQFGGVYHTKNAQADPSKIVWSQLAGLPTATGTGTVSGLKIIGGYLYASSPTLGIFRHQLGGTGWTALSNPLIDTSQSLWTSVDGYAQADGTHVLIAGCGKGVQGQNNTNHTNLVQITIPSDFPTHQATYTDLTGTATIELTTMPPDGQPWWRFPSNFTNWLGGGAFVNPHILIDPNNHRRVYVTGGGGFFRTDDVTASSVVWTVAVNGAPMSTAHLLVADPRTSGHVIVAGSDYPQTDLTDPTAWDTGNGVHATKLPQSVVQGQSVPVESHAVAFDPNSNVFTGANEKYGQNDGGAVYWRAAGDNTYTWHDTGYSDALDPAKSGSAQAPMGIFAGVDNTGTPYIVVVSQGADMWRAVPSEPTMQQPWKWTRLSTGIGTGGNVAQHCPIVAGNAAGHLFCYDRAQGLLYRSTNFGLAWALAWPQPGSGVTLNVSDARSGWLAANPAVNGELWLSTNDPGGLYKLSNAGGTISFTQPGGSSFPNGAGGIVFTSTGQPYVVALNGPLPNGSPLVSPQLLTLPPGSTTWSDAGGDSVGSYASAPGSVAITTNSSGQNLILIASSEDMGIYGVPAV